MQPVSNLGIKKPIVVTLHTKTIDAFKQIIKNQVSAVGIIDNDGKLIGNLSAHDIKLVINEPGTKLNSELQHIYSDPLFKVPRTLITCTKQDSIKHVIELLKVHEIHRVWVVEEDLTPSGVISISNICAFAKNFKFSG